MIAKFFKIHKEKIKNIAELFIQFLIFYSLATYFVEVEFLKTENSREGLKFFLWSERIVAIIFTIEYIIRWWISKNKLNYPFTWMAIVDLVSILPFYIGFMIDLRSLRLIRTLRVLRIFKVYRYNKAMNNFAISFSKIKRELQVIGVVVFVFVFLSSTIIYEIERVAQPEAFDSYSDAVWWSVVTLTTVGYGDAYPITDLGRIVAGITVVLGLGVFGTFISLIGGAFINTMQEEGTTTVPKLSYDILKEKMTVDGRFPEDHEIQHKINDLVLDHYGIDKKHEQNQTF